MRINEINTLVEAPAARYSFIDFAAAATSALGKPYSVALGDVESVAKSVGHTPRGYNGKIPNKYAGKIIDAFDRLTSGDFSLILRDPTHLETLKPDSIVEKAIKATKGFDKTHSIPVSMVGTILGKFGFTNRKQFHTELVNRAISTIPTTLVDVDDFIDIFQTITKIKLNKDLKDKLIPPAPAAPVDTFTAAQNIMSSHGSDYKKALKQALDIIKIDNIENASNLEKLGIAILAAKGLLTL
jgi:hypothetical protein